MKHSEVATQLAEQAARTRAAITELIGRGELDAAKELLAMHENLLRHEELFCIKGVLAILLGEFDEAERHLLAGLAANRRNADLTFNLAYLCQSRGQVSDALAVYRRALSLADSEELRADATFRIEQLTRTQARGGEARPAGPALVHACAAEVIGDLYRKAEAPEAAVLWYTEALKEEPSSEEVFAKWLALLVNREGLVGAIRSIEGLYGDDHASLTFVAKQCAALGYHVLREHFQYRLDTEGARVKPCQVSIASQLSRPKVSIIIPAYNQQAFLREALDSALAQDYGNLEVIVGDDHSTDGTVEMMLAYQDLPRVRYIRNQKNLGAGNNSRHLLYHHTDAEYVMILNHDDYLVRPDYISLAVDFLNKHETVSFVWANCYIKNLTSGQTGVTEIRLDALTRGADYFLNYETGRYPHVTGVLTTVFRREHALRMNCMTELTKAKDLFLYLKLMLAGDVGFIDDLVSVYRIHDNNISGNMPPAFDYATLEEFDQLRRVALNMGFKPSLLKTWLDRRVRAYVDWRFRTLWLKGLKGEALKLLSTVSRKYPEAYEAIVGSL
ncbi:MAG: glycosyltransferase [Chitinophagales bacterium]